MGVEPPGAASITFAFIPGELRIHLRQRLYLDARGLGDASRGARAIEPDDIFTDRRERMAAGALVVADQRGRGAFATGKNQRKKLIRHGSAIAEGGGDVVAVGKAPLACEPHPVRLGCRIGHFETYLMARLCQDVRATIIGANHRARQRVCKGVCQRRSCKSPFGREGAGRGCRSARHPGRDPSQLPSLLLTFIAGG
jgi:hypothetical protein